jgi:hypothetical protein
LTSAATSRWRAMPSRRCSPTASRRHVHPDDALDRRQPDRAARQRVTRSRSIGFHESAMELRSRTDGRRRSGPSIRRTLVRSRRGDRPRARAQLRVRDEPQVLPVRHERCRADPQREPTSGRRSARRRAPTSSTSPGSRSSPRFTSRAAAARGLAGIPQIGKLGGEPFPGNGSFGVGIAGASPQRAGHARPSASIGLARSLGPRSPGLHRLDQPARELGPRTGPPRAGPWRRACRSRPTRASPEGGVSVQWFVLEPANVLGLVDHGARADRVLISGSALRAPPGTRNRRRLTREADAGRPMATSREPCDRTRPLGAGPRRATVREPRAERSADSRRHAARLLAPLVPVRDTS